jgi:hypothetical protein
LLLAAACSAQAAIDEYMSKVPCNLQAVEQCLGNMLKPGTEKLVLLAACSESRTLKPMSAMPAADEWKAVEDKLCKHKYFRFLPAHFDFMLVHALFLACRG